MCVTIEMKLIHLFLFSTTTTTTTRIIGLYATFILFIGTFIRDYFGNRQSKIMFDELPNVDYLWNLVCNILVVRSESLLDLESDLYDELIMIHRDPLLLIERTRDRKREQIEADNHRAQFKRDTNLQKIN